MNFRLHIIAGTCALLGVIVAWHSWMISTAEHPVVILHRHIYIPYTDDRRICDCSQEFRDMREDIKEAHDFSMAALSYTTNFGVYANSLFQRIEKNEADIRAIEKKLKQHRHGCGEW